MALLSIIFTEAGDFQKSRGHVGSPYNEDPNIGLYFGVPSLLEGYAILYYTILD